MKIYKNMHYFISMIMIEKLTLRCTLSFPFLILMSFHLHSIFLLIFFCSSLHKFLSVTSTFFFVLYSSRENYEIDGALKTILNTIIILTCNSLFSFWFLSFSIDFLTNLEATNIYQPASSI